MPATKTSVCVVSVCCMACPNSWKTVTTSLQHRHHRCQLVNCSIPPRCKRMLSDNMNSQAMNSSRSLLHRHQRRLPIHRRRLVGNNDGDWQPHLLSRAGKKCRLSHYAVHPGASTLLCGRGRHAPALSVVLKILWRLPNKTSPLSSDTYAAHYQL